MTTRNLICGLLFQYLTDFHSITLADWQFTVVFHRDTSDDAIRSRTACHLSIKALLLRSANTSLLVCSDVAQSGAPGFTTCEVWRLYLIMKAACVCVMYSLDCWTGKARLPVYSQCTDKFPGSETAVNRSTEQKSRPKTAIGGHARTKKFYI